MESKKRQLETYPISVIDDNAVILVSEVDQHVAKNVEPKDMSPKEYKAYRLNLVAFFFFGLINNFAYVVMNSAAGDIVKKELPFAAVLIANVAPGLLVKLTAPWFMHKIPYWIRLSLIVALSMAAFYIVAFLGPVNVWIGLVGVVCASIGTGIGEPTFLALTSYYHKNVVSAWSSGTGMAGVAGAGAYLLVHTVAKLEPKWTLVAFSLFPLLLLAIYKFILQEPAIVINAKDLGHEVDQEAFSKRLEAAANQTTDPTYTSPIFTLSLRERAALMFPLLEYMIPLFVVYFAEYAINSGIQPAMTFAGVSGFDENDQYVYYQFLYQVGVFCSRSSVNLFHTKKVWIFALGQCALFAMFFTGVRYDYLPGMWFAFAFTLVEGFFGGFVYVNAFYSISRKTKPEHKEFCMGVASAADTFGILVSAVCSIYIQSYLCQFSDSPHCTN
eukprot:Nk52_evm2s2474 gene=Nk52_evmTU2s2474